jgi:hypothetical protein
MKVGGNVRRGVSKIFLVGPIGFGESPRVRAAAVSDSGYRRCHDYSLDAGISGSFEHPQCAIARWPDQFIVAFGSDLGQGRRNMQDITCASYGTIPG